jgi:hypothetical protein
MSPDRCELEFQIWWAEFLKHEDNRFIDPVILNELEPLSREGWKRAWKLSGNLALNAMNGR